jgi:C4-dicarboxylate-specific signal transduction histidine kinase
MKANCLTKAAAALDEALSRTQSMLESGRADLASSAVNRAEERLERAARLMARLKKACHRGRTAHTAPLVATICRDIVCAVAILRRG